MGSMRLWSRATRGPRAAVAGLLALLAPLAGCDRAPVARAPAVGAAAPAYAVTDLTGHRVSLSSLRGRVVVLNSWATWCIPCREEIPLLEALHQQLAGQAVTVVGVSVDASEGPADVEAFAREHGMTYPVWLDPDNQFAVRFLTVGVPETFVIDADGVIRHRVIGALPRGDTTLPAAVRAALRR